MKKLSFLLVFPLLFSGMLLAQDCTLYFPSKEGTVFEVTSYNPKGKEEGKTRTTILEKSGSGGNVEIKAKLETLDQKQPFTMDYTAVCKDGVFMVNTFSGMNTEMAGSVKVEGDFLDLPSNPSAGMSLDDKIMKMTIDVSQGTSPMPAMNMTYTFTNRKVEAIEEIETPAGKFTAMKISYDMAFKFMISANFHIVEWYVKDVGMVKSELYNSSGKMKSYSLLTKLVN